MAALLIPPIPIMTLVAALLVLAATPPAQTAISPIMLIGLIGALFSYAAMFLFAAPAHIVLSRLSLHGLVAYCATGAVSGIGVVALLSIFDHRPYLHLAPLGLFSGVLNASAFWLIRRPDRDAQDSENPR
jgi:hypothetical protein